jgi:hypothetical protein
VYDLPMNKTRLAFFAALTLVTSLSLEAQAPKGWLMRADRSASASDPDAPGTIKFSTMGTGFHAVAPQAAVFWSPQNVATGNYTLKGSFTLLKPSDHTNYYGLVFGGSGLDGPQQTYLYFMVAQDGSWLIKQRAGDASTADVAPKAKHAAVKTPDAKGTSTNDLEVRVMADKIDYVINGTVVHSTPKTGPTAKTDGIYGLRVNHRLEVHADKLTVSK